jgi:hypothetical protein
MAVHIFRREATYYWRRRTPRALANFMSRPHVFMSLRTTSPVMARRLATQLDAIHGVKEVPILSRLCVAISWSISKRTTLEMRGPGRFSLAE